MIVHDLLHEQVILIKISDVNAQTMMQSLNAFFYLSAGSVDIQINIAVFLWDELCVASKEQNHEAGIQDSDLSA